MRMPAQVSKGAKGVYISRRLSNTDGGGDEGLIRAHQYFTDYLR